MKTILALASYDKGHDFLRECKRQGWNVVLVTSEGIREKARFPMESIDEIFYMPDDHGKWDLEDTVKGVSYLARTRVFDLIVALDDFDVEVAAMLREHLRVPGMGQTTVRYFRDKLAMRMRAADAGILVPEFVAVLNHARVGEFLARVPGPWVLKPRSMAGAIGIRKVHSAQELWEIIHALGDEQSHYVLEQFVPGDIFHVDSMVHEREVKFAIASGYGKPPLEVSHGGGIFTTQVLDRESETAQRLLAENRRVLAAFGLVQGASHTEFIISHEGGRLYFLETSARVGGAHIADLVEAATGLNLWAEWAKVETAGVGGHYSVEQAREDYAGLIVSLARQKHPDTSQFTDPEVVWRMEKDHHVGLIVRSPDMGRVGFLLEDYMARITRDYHAVQPPRQRPTD
jgi:biotin carboxylase